ncbi:MAG: hypothetical protein ABIH82_02350 [Candidatus Woesearchaeota archaeon]
MDIRLTSSDALFRSLQSVTFLRNGVVVTPHQIFEAIYSGVDPLLDYNATERTNRRRPESTHQAALIEQWKNTIEDQELTAQIEILGPGDFATTVEANVRPRNNFDRNRERRPSIVELTDHLGNALYFRKSESYPTSSIFTDFYHFSVHAEDPIKSMQRAAMKNVSVKSAKPVVDRPWYNKLVNEGKIDGIHTGSGQPYHQPYVFIPEPHLMKILEQLYSEGVPRITPRGKVIEETDSASYMVRPSLNLMIDRSIDRDTMGKLGTYFGVLHALGLTDHYDRQLDHYAVQTFPVENIPDRIVNYDPDFIVLDRRRVKSRKSPQSIDANLMKAALNERFAISANEFRAFTNARTETIEEMEKLIGKQDLDHEVYRRLQGKLSDYKASQTLQHS